MKLKTGFVLYSLCKVISFDKEVVVSSTDAEQIIGREGETATLLSRCLFTLTLREFGFAARRRVECNKLYPMRRCPFNINSKIRAATWQGNGKDDE